MDNHQIENQSEIGTPSPAPTRRRRRWLWLFTLPLLAWLACLGLAVYLVSPLFFSRPQVEIPVTGGDPAGASTPVPATKAPAPSATRTPLAKSTEVSGEAFMSEAKQRLDTCTSSFHDYFVLEQMAVDHPDIFQDDTWRSDVTSAMQSFRQDCQSLGSLPKAPPAYADIDHWLKLAATEAGSSTDSLSSAIDKNQAGQFRASIDHLIKFVDYIHNAEGAMDGIQLRKQI